MISCSCTCCQLAELARQIARSQATEARPAEPAEAHPTLTEVLAQVKGWTLLDALSHVALWENERAVRQALRGVRDPSTGQLWDTCFRYAFEAVLRQHAEEEDRSYM